MKQIGYSLLLLLVLATGCQTKAGSGNIVTAERRAGSFSGVDVAQGFDVEIRRGDAPAVRIEADDNVIDDIEVKVRDGNLRIRLKSNLSLRNATLKAYITAPALKRIEASSGADVRVVDKLEGVDRIFISASSAAEIEAELDAPEVEAKSSSGARAELRGRTRKLDADASSGAEVLAASLMAEDVRAEASSGARVEAFASLRLDAKASSGASVRYRGGATDVKKSESSGGSVSTSD